METKALNMNMEARQSSHLIRKPKYGLRSVSIAECFIFFPFIILLCTSSQQHHLAQNHHYSAVLLLEDALRAFFCATQDAQREFCLQTLGTEAPHAQNGGSIRALEAPGLRCEEVSVQQQQQLQAGDPLRRMAPSRTAGFGLASAGEEMRTEPPFTAWN